MDGEPVSLSDSSSGSNWSENEGKRILQGKKRKTRSFKNKKHVEFVLPIRRRGKSENPNSRQSMGQQMTNNSLIPVTCGKKEGLLDVDKWKNKMEDCILSEDKWYKPSEFEIYGGEKKKKKWKTSIFYQGVTLQKLIEDKLLSSPVFKRRRTQNEQRKSSPVADGPSGCDRLNFGNNMDFESFSNQRLFDFFCKNKTKMSMISDPVMLLRHLQDNQIIKETRENAHDTENSNERFYNVLSYIENSGLEHVRRFWNCVNMEHILERYPQISELTQTLKNELPGESPDEIQVLLEQTETTVSVESETIHKPNFADEEPPQAELSDFKMVQISLGAESSVQVAISEGLKCEPEPEERWITETTEKNIPFQEHTQEQLLQQCQSASIVPAPTIARKLQEVLEMQVEVLELKKIKLQLEIEQIKKEMGNQ